jgi:hypothetical protein
MYFGGLSMRHLTISLLVLPLGLAVLGCGGGESLDQPIMPPPADTSIDIPARLPDTSGHNLWTYRDVFIDPASLEYEILPDRIVEGHWNVLSWLENGPCTSCFGIAGITPSGNGTLLVDITVSHPFPSANLTGFDVRGIPIFNGSMTFPESGWTASDRSKGDGELVNADGYTTLYNPTTVGSGPAGLQGYIEGRLARSVPDATLNGYKRHVSDDAANTRNAFYAGDSVTVTYEIDMPDGPFVFGYAVDANWAPPINNPVEDPMTDFGSDANCPEPWKIEVTETPVGDGLTDLGGSTVLTIDAYSHVPGPFTVTAEAPGLFGGEISTDISTGSGDGYTSYELTVENSLTASAGDYRLLLAAVNQNNPVVPDWIDLTAYSIVPLQVTGSLKSDPVAQAKALPTTQEAGIPVSFSDDGSYDPDGGPIVNYEWDWNNDGVYDQTGMSVDHTFDSAGTYNVQFRVTDDESATDVLDTPLVITITPAQTGYTWDGEIEAILHNTCSPCHINNSSGGVEFTTYQTMLDSHVVKPGFPLQSKLYTEVYQGEHFATPTSEKLDMIYQWIEDGAPEN